MLYNVNSVIYLGGLILKEILDSIIGFFDVFNYIEFWNIIDIAILTLLLYSILKLLRKTKGEQLIKGFIFILLILKLSEILKLTAINWIIQSTLDFGVIAFIVIFQPEFRKILEKVGRKTIFNRKKTNNNEILDFVSILEKSVFKMSSSRTGALITIGRLSQLDDYLVNSTPLDSIITEELLLNIFIDGSPLHDGSIIICENRIKACNCVLPLSEKDLPVEYGTRHRAAIGLSEACDAIIVVVSEETGKVSICVDSKLIKIPDKIQFKKELYDLLTEYQNFDDKGGSVWRRILKKK